MPVSINEFMLPRAWKMKTAREDDLARITGLEMRHVYNEIQLLSDYEVIGVPETRLYQVSAHFIHLLAMLPLCEYYSARHIVLNNELLNTLTYLHRTGIIAPQRFMQSRRATDIMRSMAAFATGGTVSVVNLIDGLGDFAIHYLLHEHFPELSKLRISCDMELTRHRLWCHNCDRCARAYLFSLALDENTEEMGFRRSMAGKKLMKHFNALNRHHRRDEYREFTGREERLACRMARAHGHRHPLISALGYDAVPDTKEDFSSMARTVFGIHERRFLRPLYRRNRKIIDSMLSKIRSCSGGGIHF
ncbi:MAG: hypothetical protein JXA20_07330 [Spirochaetes bacterium]|nr:hypothetical protein [Spirochaetota bacterium]